MEKIVGNNDNVLGLINEDRGAAIDAILASEAFRDSCHVDHKRAMEIWCLAHGITKEQRIAEEERLALEATSPEALELRAEIQRRPAFQNRLHPEHKGTHTDWLKTFE